jgi:hypothetical protein
LPPPPPFLPPSGEKLFHVLYSSINGGLTSSSHSSCRRTPLPLPLIIGEPSPTWNTATTEPIHCLHAIAPLGWALTPFTFRADSTITGSALSEDRLEWYPPSSCRRPRRRRHSGCGDRPRCALWGRAGWATPSTSPPPFVLRAKQVAQPPRCCSIRPTKPITVYMFLNFCLFLLNPRNQSKIQKFVGNFIKFKKNTN